MESTLKGIRGCDAPCVLDMDDAATVAGGVGDTYGEDCATEDQLVTPWTVSVARSACDARSPRFPPIRSYDFARMIDDLFLSSDPPAMLWALSCVC
jgi:hypothetical protein